MNIVFGYFFTYLYSFSILILAHFLQKRMNLEEETSRKIVHILESFTWFIMIYFFKNTWHLLIPPLTFTILNYVSYKKNIFKVMERKEINSPGTVYYAFSMLVLSILSILDSRFVIPYGIGIFCMAIGDGLAPYFAKKYKSIILQNQKTLVGTLTVFFMSFFVIILFTWFMNLPLSHFEILWIALVSAVLELVGTKGLDNLFLPIGVATASYLSIVL